MICAPRCCPPSRSRLPRNDHNWELRPVELPQRSRHDHRRKPLRVAARFSCPTVNHSETSGRARCSDSYSLAAAGVSARTASSRLMWVSFFWSVDWHGAGNCARVGCFLHGHGRGAVSWRSDGVEGSAAPRLRTGRTRRSVPGRPCPVSTRKHQRIRRWGFDDDRAVLRRPAARDDPAQGDISFRCGASLAA